MLFENSKLVRVIAEPHQISVGLREQALEPRVVREFFDDERLAHSGVISGLMNPVKQVRSKLIRIGEVRQFQVSNQAACTSIGET